MPGSYSKRKAQQSKRYLSNHTASATDPEDDASYTVRNLRRIEQLREDIIYLRARVV